MSFEKVVFTISKEQSIFIDEQILEDKKKPENERRYKGGRSEFVRKLIISHRKMKESEIGEKCTG